MKAVVHLRRRTYPRDVGPGQRPSKHAHEPFRHAQDRINLLLLLQTNNFISPRLYIIVPKIWAVLRSARSTVLCHPNYMSTQLRHDSIASSPNAPFTVNFIIKKLIYINMQAGSGVKHYTT